MVRRNAERAVDRSAARIVNSPSLTAGPACSRLLSLRTHMPKAFSPGESGEEVSYGLRMEDAFVAAAQRHCGMKSGNDRCTESYPNGYYLPSEKRN
jgi:hypothetical protein